MKIKDAYQNLEMKMVSVYGTIPHEILAEMVALSAIIDVDGEIGKAVESSPLLETEGSSSSPESVPEAVPGAPVE